MTCSYYVRTHEQFLRSLAQEAKVGWRNPKRVRRIPPSLPEGFSKQQRAGHRGTTAQNRSAVLAAASSPMWYIVNQRAWRFARHACLPAAHYPSLSSLTRIPPLLAVAFLMWSMLFASVTHSTSPFMSPQHKMAYGLSLRLSPSRLKMLSTSRITFGIGIDSQKKKRNRTEPNHGHDEGRGRGERWMGNEQVRGQRRISAIPRGSWCTARIKPRAQSYPQLVQ